MRSVKPFLLRDVFRSGVVDLYRVRHVWGIGYCSGTPSKGRDRRGAGTGHKFEPWALPVNQRGMRRHRSLGVLVEKLNLQVPAAELRGGQSLLLGLDDEGILEGI